MSADGMVTLMNGEAASWTGLMLRACASGGLFVLCLWAVCRLCPRLPASGRAWLWWLASLKLVMGLCGCLAISLPLLPQAHPLQTAAVPVQMPPTSRAAPVSGADAAAGPQPTVMGASTAPGQTDALPVPSASEARTRPSWLVCLAALWLLGVVACLAVSARHFWALRRMLRRSRSLDATLLGERLRRLSDEMGLRGAPRLVASDAVTVPCVSGLVRPIILLPGGFSESLSADELSLALAHELAHLRRGDLGLALVPALSRTLFWFFPPAWLTCHECEIAREEACDAEALCVTGAHPARYGQLLLKIVTPKTPSACGASLGLTAGYAALKTRLVAIARLSSGGRRARHAAALLLALALLFVLPWRLTAVANHVLTPSDRNVGDAPLPQYLVSELDAPGGRETYAAGLNDRAQVVGESGGRALLWEHGMAYVLKPSPRLRYGLASGINNGGQIIASSYSVMDHIHAVLWQHGRRPLGTLPGFPYSEALGINDGGQIVGDSLTARVDHQQGEQVARAFLWSAGKMHDLGTLGGDYSYAYAINNAGQVVGKSDTETYGSTHAFLWQNGQMTDLSALPGGQNSLAYALSNNGQAAGFSQTADGFSHAVLWDNGQARDLGTLGGDTDSEAHAINDGGQIVGASSGGPDAPNGRAFLWQNGRMTDLNSLLPPGSGWVLEDARAINSAGQIVGQGLYKGRERAFLLTPLTNANG